MGEQAGAKKVESAEKDPVGEYRRWKTQELKGNFIELPPHITDLTQEKLNELRAGIDQETRDKIDKELETDFNDPQKRRQLLLGRLMGNE